MCWVVYLPLALALTAGGFASQFVVEPQHKLEHKRTPRTFFFSSHSLVSLPSVNSQSSLFFLLVQSLLHFSIFALPVLYYLSISALCLFSLILSFKGAESELFTKVLLLRPLHKKKSFNQSPIPLAFGCVTVSSVLIRALIHKAFYPTTK